MSFYSSYYVETLKHLNALSNIYRDYDFVDALTDLMTYKGKDIDTFSNIKNDCLTKRNKYINNVKSALEDTASSSGCEFLLEEFIAVSLYCISSLSEKFYNKISKEKEGVLNESNID